MALEIERKFLVRADAWREAAAGADRLVQGYVANTARCSVRIRVAGESAWLSLKGMQPGTTRHEFEYPVPVADALHALETMCEGPRLEKLRHRVPAGRHVFEVDEFLGASAGLVIAEVELGAEDEEFERPAWLGEEVTLEPRYYSFVLARTPFATWPEADRAAARAGRHLASGAGPAP